MQIHGFCDASEKGYGAVIYTKTKVKGNVHIEIIASKSRVAPLKVITVPRLELCGANLLINLMEMIMPIFKNHSIQCYCWSDSQIVLKWLDKSPADLKTYVANRIANIQTKSETLKVKWNWIAGLQNPADLISRGTTIEELNKEQKWWHGPEWLIKSEKEWPSQPLNLTKGNIEELHREEKVIHMVIKGQDHGLRKGKWYKFDKNRQKTFALIDAYGEWKRLLRVTATILRAVYNFKHYKEKRSGMFSKEELETARNFIIKTDQERFLQREINEVKKGTSNSVGKLVVLYDTTHQFLRIDGRIRSDNVKRDEQFPIVLSKDSTIALLLIRDAHQKTNHGGNQLVLQYLRAKFWLRMTTSKQLMATLPTYRTSPARAFSRVGIDYAGPVTVRSALGKFPKLTKAWIAVFVCLTTRAIHLELVSDASTQAFIAALKRMVSRRGIISEVISDNGTNFVGANNYLKSVVTELEQNSSNLEEKFEFKWHFITPNAPHHGGIYEAAVKSVKYHLTRIIGDTTLTFEEYATVLSQAEACVNSRPLSALSDDPTSYNALTPGHFIIGEPLIRIPDETDFREIPVNRLDRWKHIQKMAQHFWERWHQEYLSNLINRSKWTQTQRNIQEGDLVVVKEDNMPPQRWKLGRVQQVLPSKDNLVRTVIVKTPTGVYKRPIVKLGLLLTADE